MSLLSDCNNAYDVGPNNVGYGLPYPHAGAQNTAKAACDTCVSKGEKLESMGYIDAGDCANASDQREYDDDNGYMSDGKRYYADPGTSSRDLETPREACQDPYSFLDGKRNAGVCEKFTMLNVDGTLKNATQVEIVVISLLALIALIQVLCLVLKLMKKI